MTSLHCQQIGHPFPPMLTLFLTTEVWQVCGVVGEESISLWNPSMLQNVHGKFIFKERVCVWVRVRVWVCVRACARACGLDSTLHSSEPPLSVKQRKNVIAWVINRISRRSLFHGNCWGFACVTALYPIPLPHHIYGFLSIIIVSKKRMYVQIV
jgi:hypothetical protein